MSGPSGGAVDEPGQGARVPFRFACQRSGRCCSAGSGYVWVEEHELARLSRRIGLGVDDFARRYLRTVADPRTGVLRLALRERGAGESAGALVPVKASGGACVLLEGVNHCRVYEDRPGHCASFPYWPSVMKTVDGFERARAICPGIAPQISADQRARAFAALEALYEKVESITSKSGALCLARGLCCRFEQAGHELWATGLEADYAAYREPNAPAPEEPGRCPYHVDGRCTARAARALGCRTYYCDPRLNRALEEEHELLLGEVRRIERETGYPPSYAPFPGLLMARGVGRAEAGAPA